MAVFKCRICGGTVEFEEGATVGVCDSCGTKQTLQELEKGRDAGVSAEENPVGIAPLLKRVFMFLEDGDWNSADEYCEKVLDQDPENAQAYLGKLMAECHVHKQEELRDCPVSFETSNNYKKAIRFADPALVKELQNDIAFIKERNEKARLNSIYDSAVRALESANTEEACKAAAESFKKIPGFRDADALAEKCLEKAEVCRKNEIYFYGIAKMEDPEVSVDLCESAISFFQRIPGWKDADELIEVCRQKIKEIEAKLREEAIEAEKRRKDEIYFYAKAKMNDSDGLVSACEKAIESFQKIPGWRDADELISVCRQKIKEIEDKQLEEKRKLEELQAAQEAAKRTRNRVIAIVLSAFIFGIVLFSVLTKVTIPSIRYNSAMKNYDVGNYQEAYETFLSLSYKDSEEMATKCFQVIQYDSAIEFYNTGKYQEAYEAFHALAPYADSLKKAEECMRLAQQESLSSVQVGDIVKFGSYEQDYDFTNGKEQIDWIVLDIKKGKALIISKYVLDCRELSKTPSHGYISWWGSSLRRWCLNVFPYSAFTWEDRDLISPMPLDGEGNEKIFFLSISEVEKYFGTEEERKCVPTAYAVEQGVKSYSDYTTIDGAPTCDWWLRTDVANNAFACVLADGMIGDSYDEDNPSLMGLLYGLPSGVRPALWIDLES